MSNHTPQLNSAEFLSAVLRVIHYKKYIYTSLKTQIKRSISLPPTKNKKPRTKKNPHISKA